MLTLTWTPSYSATVSVVRYIDVYRSVSIMTEMILRPRTLTSAYGSSFRSDSSENKPGYCKASIFAVEGSSATSGAYGKDAVTLLLRSCEDDGERATSMGGNPIGDGGRA